MHGANLMKALRARLPDTEMFGIGGARMRREGLRCIFPAEELSVVGLVEVLKRLPFYLKILKLSASAMCREQVDAFIPIDFPDFNIALAKSAQKNHIPVLYYICPQVWAWRSGRIKTIEERVDLLLTIFPFEPQYFSKERLNALYVGHPVLDDVEIHVRSRDAVTRGQGTCAILPGSRHSEVFHHMPVLVPFIAAELRAHPELRFVIPCAESLDPDLLHGICAPVLNDSAIAGRLEIAGPGQSLEVMRRADAALIASGTSTLQAVLCDIPFAIFYRVNPMTAWLGKRLIRIGNVGLVNLVAGKTICREFLQEDMRADNLKKEMENLMWNSAYRQTLLDSFVPVRHTLGKPGASAKAADAMVQFLDKLRR